MHTSFFTPPLSLDSWLTFFSSRTDIFRAGRVENGEVEFFSLPRFDLTPENL
jgi:hypothetical protein